MNNNYKKAFSSLSPSEEAVERILNIPNKQKNIFRLSKMVCRRLASATLALMLVISGGFGIDYIAAKQSANTLFNSDKLSVLVAYAYEKGVVEIEDASALQDFFYRIYVIDYKDKETVDNATLEYYREYHEIRDEFEKIGKKGAGASLGGSHSTIVNENKIIGNHYEQIGMLYTVSAGNFALNINDYTDIENITVENTSKYAELQLEYAAEGPDIAIDNQKLDFDMVWHPVYQRGNKVSADGKALQWSLESGFMESGTGKYAVNKAFIFNWCISTTFENEINKNIDFDLSQIKDTITVTVHYLDGSTGSTSFQLNCDKDGYVHLSNND